MKLHSKVSGRGLLLPAAALCAFAAAVLSGCLGDGGTSNPSTSTTTTTPAAAPGTATPIKHLVVIFQENVSFDHYFATYPVATNPTGSPIFKALPGTPAANTLTTPLDPKNNFAPLASSVNLMTQNPNFTNLANNNATNNSIAANPFRLDRTQFATADQSHNYDTEQEAFDNGAMDLFPVSVGRADSVAPQPLITPLNTTGLVMGYYDGNSVTAIWNYAQHFAMNDNSYNTTFGPSAPGAINLVSGQTNGVIASNAAARTPSGTTVDGDVTNDGAGGVTLVSDGQPLGDVCTNREAEQLGGKNIGDLLNAAKISWGWFQGGFDLTITNADGSTGCNRTTTGLSGVKKTDYIQHHQPFQYYVSTANPTHARPSSVATIGSSFKADGVTPEPANHQYDIHDFFDAVSAGNFPAVSFLKAPGYQDGHAQYSNPLDEQAFVVQVINFLQSRPEWSSTAVVISYDDSDGWYDHQMSPIVNPSLVASGSASVTLNGLTVAGLFDHLNGPGLCNSGAQQGTPTPAKSLAGYNGTPNVQGRCGYGPRLPLMVISPFAKANYIDHTLTDQTSILRFIENNWLSGQRITGSFDAIAGPLNNMFNFTATTPNPVLILDPSTGLPAPCATCV